ncbi:MAG: VanZ family protein [Chloroflexota bacterium]
MNWDLTLLNFFNQRMAHPVLDWVMIFATVVGLWLLPASGIALYWRGQRRVGLNLLLALGISMLGTFAFYYLALRPRPVNVRLLLPTPDFPSFPSGHTAAAFSTAIFLILVNHKRHQDLNQQSHWLGVSGIFAGALLITLSRLYLGHHYPTDLLGGAALGSAVGACVYGFTLTQSTWLQRLRWLLWPQIAIVILVTEMAYLNLLPGNLLSWPMADKVLHFTLFGAVTFWLNLWFQGRTVKILAWSIPLAILVPLAFALVEEGLQAWSPLRTASLVDLGADAMGMLVFYVLSNRLLAIDSHKVTRQATLHS